MGQERGHACIKRGKSIHNAVQREWLGFLEGCQKHLLCWWKDFQGGPLPTAQQLTLMQPELLGVLAASLQAKKHASWNRRRSWVLCCIRQIHRDCQRAPLVKRIIDNQSRISMVRRRLRGKQAPGWRIVACFLSRSFHEVPGIARLIFSFI